MYCVKGSWAGQTFALAAANESGGKKSRIRLSKEKRKSLVETFIKRYQSSNNGSFPSLNLTHKEVGGSFYTVREIVREIIQENRVLGPGQSSSEEQNDEFMTVNYPLGSIASDPPSVLFEKTTDLNSEEEKETVVLKSGNSWHFNKRFDLDVVQYSIDKSADEIGEDDVRLSVSEVAINSEDSKEASLEASLDSNRNCVNVSEANDNHSEKHMHSNGTSEEPSKLLVEEDEEFEKMGSLQGKVSLPTEEVKVESFPLRSAIDVGDDSGSSSTNFRNFDEKLNDLEAEKVELSNGTIVLEKASSMGSSPDLLTTKGADSSEVSVSGDSGGSADTMIHNNVEVNNMVNQHGKVDLKNDSEDVSYSLPIKDDSSIPYNGLNQLLPNCDFSETTEKNKIQPKDASEATSNPESSNVTSRNNVKETTVASDHDFKRDDKAKVGSSPPLDRIDLGSWKASKQEPNPLLAIFKAFVDAFVKFWSE